MNKRSLPGSQADAVAFRDAEPADVGESHAAPRAEHSANNNVSGQSLSNSNSVILGKRDFRCISNISDLADNLNPIKRQKKACKLVQPLLLHCQDTFLYIVTFIDNDDLMNIQLVSKSCRAAAPSNKPKVWRNRSVIIDLERISECECEIKKIKQYLQTIKWSNKLVLTRCFYWTGGHSCLIHRYVTAFFSNDVNFKHVDELTFDCGPLENELFVRFFERSVNHKKLGMLQIIDTAIDAIAIRTISKCINLQVLVVNVLRIKLDNGIMFPNNDFISTIQFPALKYLEVSSWNADHPHPPQVYYQLFRRMLDTTRQKKITIVLDMAAYVPIIFRILFCKCSNYIDRVDMIEISSGSSPTMNMQISFFNLLGDELSNLDKFQITLRMAIQIPIYSVNNEYLKSAIRMFRTKINKCKNKHLIHIVTIFGTRCEQFVDTDVAVGSEKHLLCVRHTM